MFNIFKWFNFGPKCDCGEAAINKYRVITVRGREVGCFPHHRCVLCSKKYLEEKSTTCAKCGEAIFPGESVTDSGRMDGTVVCDTSRCSVSGACRGYWGEGELVPLSLDKRS